MAINTGYLTSDRKNDELYTPFYAVDPIVKYLPKDKIIEKLVTYERPLISG